MMVEGKDTTALAPWLTADILAVVVSLALVALVKAGLLPAIGW